MSKCLKFDKTGKRMEKQVLTYTTDMNKISVIFLEGDLSVSKLKMYIPFDLLSMLGIYPTKLLAKEFYTHRKMFAEALFIIANNQK